METGKKDKATGLIGALTALFCRARAIKKHINESMAEKYSPRLIAMTATACAALLMLFILFVPPYLGVGDDGNFTPVMQSVGLSYISENIAADSNAYFNRVYAHAGYSAVSDGPRMVNSQILLLRAAIVLDNLVTRDTFFDIRILALLYTLLFLPAFYLLIRQVCLWTNRFFEGVIIGILGVFVFADIAYISYFNSLYPEALWFICILYAVSASLSFQKSRSFVRDFLSLLLLAAAGLTLMTSRSQCALTGLIFALFCIRLLFIRKEWEWGVVCVLAALFLSLVSFGCMVWMQNDFDETDRFHAMTSGVMFEADNPAEVLRIFGIDSSYELLADASLYDELPLTTVGEEVVQEGFLDRYTTNDIMSYYLAHPGKFARMLDIAVKSCFGIRRDYCGNYERSVGLPASAKSLFWSAYSTFKNTSAPKTIGYLVVLIGAACLLFYKGYSLRPVRELRSCVLLDCFWVMLLILLYQAGITIVNSGEAAMIQHCFLVSACMDIMTYLVIARLVHRVNIF